MKVEQIITSIRVKFIHNLRLGRLPIEFSDFVTANNENIRMSQFSTFNYILTKTHLVQNITLLNHGTICLLM